MKASNMKIIKLWGYLAIFFNSLCHSFEMSTDIEPDMDTRPPKLSNDSINSKKHNGNLEIFHPKIHTYAILRFCSGEHSVELVVVTFTNKPNLLNGS